MVTQSSIPADFPKAASGAVPGTQLKLLARVEVGRFVAGPGDADVLARYVVCEDLAQQLAKYSVRKGGKHPEWSREQLQAKVAAAVRAKGFGWGLSPAEVEWVLQRLAELTA